MKVGRTRDEDEAMRRKDGGCVFMIVGRKVAGEGDAYVRIETRTPHEDEIFTKFVDA